MGECNTFVSACTLYRHFHLYCTHLSNLLLYGVEDSYHYTPVKLMFSGLNWNRPVCQSVRMSVYKILVSVKGLAEVLTLSQKSPGFYMSAVQVF